MDDLDPYNYFIDDVTGTPIPKGPVQREVLRSRSSSSITNKPTTTTVPYQPPQQSFAPNQPQMPMPQQPQMPQQPAAQPAPGDWLARNRADQERVRSQLQGLDAEPDLGPIQQAATAQRQQGKQNLLLALAAQQAGEQFQPLQGQFLKKAMEQQGPYKFTGGHIDEEGRVVRDPFFQQEQKRKTMESQLQHLSDQERQFIAEQAKIAETARHNGQTELYQQTMATIRSALAGNAAENRATAADQKNWRFEDSAQKQYDGQTKDYRQGLDASRNVQQLISSAAGQPLQNVQQQAVITLFNKFLDPGSVVREGEFNRMAQGMGLFQRVQNMLPKLTVGSIITPQMVQQINEVAQFYQNANQKKIQAVGDEYHRKATTRGLDPHSIIVDPYYDFSRAPGGQAAPQGAVREKATPSPAPTVSTAPAGAVREKKTP